jgi:archaemetzincin
MKRLRLTLFCLLLSGCYHTEPQTIETVQVSAESSTAETKIAKLSKIKEVIAPFFVKMGKPEKGDWLKTIPEAGETFEEYVKNKPILPSAEKQTIYIQPIGKFSVKQRKVLLLTAAYMRGFYHLPVQLRAESELANVPPKMTRKNLYAGQTQVKTTYFLDDLLPKLIPADAAALICLTTADLFPEEEWSYVFGQADLRGRVGVWSLYRLGDPNKSAADEKIFLARTLKIAMHETGHMFSMRHCTKYECLMSGTNNLDETDRRPLDVCPECAAKIAWAMNYEPLERYRSLADFWNAQGWRQEAQVFTKKAEAVSLVKN